MQKIDELNRARNLLTQALSAALHSLPNNRSVQEARSHMKRALNELDHAAKTQTRKQSANATQAKEWWGQVEAGTVAMSRQPTANEATQPTATEAAQRRALQSLDAMIANEQKILDDLEKQSEPPVSSPALFND